MIVIANYGVGNLRSVERMLRKAGAEAQLSSDPETIRKADKLILPGIGHFGHCMQEFTASPFYKDVLWFALESGKPILGICVGAQMLGHSSEEAPGVAGLGWIDMVVRRFPEQPGYRVPNMGWNTVTPARPNLLVKDLNEDSRFYFAHSFYMDCADQDAIMVRAHYGFEYTVGVNKKNIYGLQFHPEKSLRHGMAVMKAFSEL